MQRDKDINERVTKLETTVEAHALDLINLHQTKHKHASWITSLLNKLGVMEVQVKAHDRVMWATLFGLIGVLVTVIGVLVMKYVLK